MSRETEDGTFWADMWNSVMKRCGGFEPEDETNDYENIDDRKLSSKKQLKKPLPCLPSTVIYGHTASQGLDVRRWTMGLDSGCVRLTLSFDENFLTLAWAWSCRFTDADCPRSYWHLQKLRRKTTY